MIPKPKIFQSTISLSLTSRCRTDLLSYFSSDTSNIRVPLVHPESHKLTDEHIYKYENKMFSAYLKKRSIPKSHIYPKIHIIDNVPQSQKNHLQYQRMFPLKKTLDEATMKKIATDDPTKINSAYIISMFADEDGFKEMIDEYVEKVLVCGKAPGGVDSNSEPIDGQAIDRMQDIEEQVLDLYRIYYFGENLTDLQKQIEHFYLVQKQQKHLNKQVKPKNAYNRCIWRNQDQKLLEGYANWPVVDLNQSDLNNRPFYEAYPFKDRLPYVEKLYSLIGADSFLERVEFTHKIKPKYVYSYLYLNNVTEKLMSRVIPYTKCIEFTNQMRIPPDFSIEISVLNLHIWLIIDRLKQFDSKQSKNLIKMLQKTHKTYVRELLETLNLKKLATKKKQFNDRIDLLFKIFNFHFYGYKDTKTNPYNQIDALVWSIVFLEKVERYSDEVYRMSQYIIKNRQLLQRHSQQDIFSCLVQFDVFFCDPDHKQNIIKINPQMDPEAFEEQFNNDKQYKEYYYKTHQKDFEIQIDFKEPQSTKYSFLGALANKTLRFIKKYLISLDKYDDFSELDDQAKQIKKKQERSPWKAEVDKINEMDDEFNSLRNIKRNKRRSNLHKNHDGK